jgi:hypothetical protein
MIQGIFHEGSGLGDQLFRYITVRTLAEEKGYEWGMLGDFKGKEFMTIDYGKPPIAGEFPMFQEKDVRDKDGNDIRSYDPEINFVEDGTVVDGSFEDAKYWGHNLPKIRNWLKVEKIWEDVIKDDPEYGVIRVSGAPDDLCIIGFRGGEYATNAELFLTKEYWDRAITIMRERHPGIRFEVHTDDPETARACFPMFPVIDNQQLSHSTHSSMGLNWRTIRCAKHLIVANSAFFIIPMLIGDAKDIIAPRYWARHNTKVWARPACYYKDHRISYI